MEGFAIKVCTVVDAKLASSQGVGHCLSENTKIFGEITKCAKIHRLI